MMPTLRCGKMYSFPEKQESQVTICPQNAVPIEIRSKNLSPKITATGESLFSIHKKIQRHLTGRKLLTKFEVRKLMLIVKKMHCSSPTEHEIIMTAQNILAQIYRRMIAENTTYENSDLLKNEQDSTEITDTSSLEKYETLCSAISNLVTNNSNSDNNISLLSTLNDELSKNLFQESANLIGEAGNEILSSQCQSSDIIKLRFNGVEAYEQDDGSLSFPLELLTNNDFVISQKNANSGLMNQKETCTGNNSISNTENGEFFENTSAVDNNSDYKENMSYDEVITDNNTQVNFLSNEYSCEITPEISSLKIPESNNQIEVGCISDNAKVSKIMEFELNAKDILTISSFTVNTPPSSYEALKKTMTNTAVPSDRTELGGSNLSMSLTENISLSAQKIHEESADIEDPSQQTVVDYKNELTQIPYSEEEAIWKKANDGISQETEYDLSDSNSPEIILIDCESTNSENIDDDVEITDPSNKTFPKAQSQAIKSAEYSQLTSTDSVWKESQNRMDQSVVYDLDPLDSPAPTPQENSAILFSLQEINTENGYKSNSPRDKFELQSARQTFVKTNDVLPIPTECNLDTGTVNLETNVADDVAITTNLGKELQDKGVSDKIIDQSDNESFVFNLEGINNAIDVIEATPSSKLEQESPLKGQARKSETIMDNSETEDIIIEETGYTRSESAIFKTHSFKKYGVSSPYRSQNQSNSFLNYKSHAKSPRSMPSRNRYSGMASSVGGYLPPDAQSNNIIMINGEIPKRQDRMESTPIEAKEESFSEKQAKLLEKVMRKRDAYRAKWKDIPITEKISPKFIQKFHVRIFEDPVNSLTNIDYKPNFNTFHFTRLTITEINEEMKSTWEMSKKIDDALTKAVRGLQERSTKDWASAFLRRTTNELDSDDSSDEENKANNKWLIEYMQKAQYETNVFNDETCKEIRSAESERRNTWDTNVPADDEDRDEQLEKLIEKLGDFDWLID